MIASAMLLNVKRNKKRVIGFNNNSSKNSRGRTRTSDLWVMSPTS